MADLTGKSRQAIHKIARQFHGGRTKPWMGAVLKVREAPGSGGRGGTVLLIEVESLPEPLQAAWKARGRPVQLALPLRQDDAATAERRERVAIVELIVAHPEGSAERRAAKKAVLGSIIIRNGRREPLSESTLRRWVKNFEAGGELALQRKERKDAGQAAVDVTQRWDRIAAELPEAKRAEIAAQIGTFLFSRWAEGCSFAMVKHAGQVRLAKLTREAGCTLSDAELKAACVLSKGAVEARRRDGQKAFTRKRDAKGHDDRVPRMRFTHRHYVPGRLVFCDCHHVDVYLMREDGKLATPKAIAWLDARTRRLRIDLVLCETGTGIRNADVIESFIKMTQDPEWGVPSQLYLDNGSEYNFADFLSDPLKLANMGCEVINPVQRARAYNAAAKGVLEGSFRILERWLKPLKGSIPGNRMLTRSANLGQPPAPFDGSFDDFARKFSAVLGFHNANPQKGDLGGLSPMDDFRKAVAAGWTRVDVDGDTLRTAFSVTEHRTVSRGKIRVGGEVLYCDGLAALDGERVRIQRPKYLSWDGVAVYDRRNVFVGVAHLDVAGDPLDRDNARESARRRRVAFDASDALVSEVDDESIVQLLVDEDDKRERLPSPPSAGKIVLAPEAEEIALKTNSTPRQRANSKATEAQKRQEARLALFDKLEGK